jgi:cell division protein FtsB
MDFIKKQKGLASLKEFFIKTAAVFIIFVFAVLIVADIKIYQKRKGLEAEVAKYEQQINEIKNKNKDLEERIANADNSDYIEKVAREEQDMQKPGEKVVSFVMPEEKKQEETVENIWDVKNWFGWIGNSWNWIKGLF